MPNMKINNELIKGYINKNCLTIREFCRQCDITYRSYLKIMKSTIIRFKPIYNVATTIKVKLSDLIKY